MAANDKDARDDEVLIDEKNSENKTNFKCCVKKSVQVLVCTNCYAVFHGSCAKRYPALKSVKDHLVKCCEEQTIKDTVKIVKEEEYYIKENRLLKDFIEEIKDKNAILKENNRLLLQRMEYLEKQTEEKPKKVQKNVNTAESVAAKAAKVSRSTSNQHENTNNSQIQKSRQEINDNHRNDKQLSFPVFTQPYPQFSYRDRNVNIVNIEEENNEDMEDEQNVEENGNFKTVQYKRNRKRVRTNVGTAVVNEEEKENGFSGEDRKVWLYINRVKRTADEEKVKTYISKKPGYSKENVMVCEIPGFENQLKRFVVTAPIDKKEEMYNPQFWPTGVGIKRFDFSKHKDFLRNHKAADF